MTTPLLAGVTNAAGFQPILEAVALGLVELPPELARLIATGPKLAAATVAGRKSVETARAELAEARQAAVTKLLAGGSTASPGLPIRIATTKLDDAAGDVDLLAIAASRSLRSTPAAFLDAYPGIAAQLAERLPALLDDGRPHAEILARAELDWAGLPLLELDAPQLAAFHALEPLARQADALRQAALALYQDLNRHDDHYARRHAILRALDVAASHRGKGNEPSDAWVELFVDVGGGIAGPARKLHNTAPSPSLDKVWRWAPERWPQPHPVARLILSALAPVPEPTPDPESPEPDQATPRDMRPMLPPTGPKPVRSLPKMSRTEPHIGHRNRPGR